MAFILKCTKFIYTAYKVSGKRDLMIRQKNLLLEYPKRRVLNLNERHAGTIAPAVAERNYNETESNGIDELVHQLSNDMNSRNILIEDVKNVLSAVEKKGELEHPQLTLLLKSCIESTFMAKDEERVALAENIWNLADRLGVQFKINHYNTLLKVYLSNNHKFNVEKFIETLHNNKVNLTHHTYSLLLRAHCQQGNIEGASQILSEIKKNDYPLGEEDFASLIEGHCQLGDFVKANELLNIMIQKNTTPTMISYNKLLLGYAKYGKIEELNQLLDKLDKNGIGFGNSCLLEIIYTLAVNNHESHIDSIMERFGGNRRRGLFSNRMIQKFLHERLDSLALKIFEREFSHETEAENLAYNSKFIIKHFVLYRKPEEVLKMSVELEGRGWAPGALAYAFREISLNKDVGSALNFLRAMKQHEYEVRPHYYWPLIIKASKKGKPYLQRILRRIPRNAFSEDLEAFRRIVLPNYNVENKNDRHLLVDIGVRENILDFCLFDKLLHDDMLGAEELITQRGIMARQWGHFINCIVLELSKNQERIESVLNILHALGHDFYYEQLFLKNGAEEEEDFQEEDKPNHGASNFVFDRVIRVLVRTSKDEKLLTDVLEGMLKKKLGISPESVDVIASSFESEKITDLAKKLTEPEAQFDLDMDLVRKKIWRTPPELFALVSANAKDLLLNRSLSASAIVEKLGPDASVADLIFVAYVLMQRKSVAEAIEIIKKLDRPNGVDIPKDAQRLAEHCILQMDLHSSRNGVKVFEALVDAGIARQTLSRVLIRLINRYPLKDCLEVYERWARKFNNVHGCFTLISKACSTKDNEALARVRQISSEFIPGSRLACMTVVSLASSGQNDKAKRLLDSENIPLPQLQKTLYSHCELHFNLLKKSINFYKNLFEFVKDLPGFDRIPLHKFILRKHALENNLTEALEWCDVIEADQSSDYKLLKDIYALRRNPTKENLRQLVKSFDSEDGSDSEGRRGVRPEEEIAGTDLLEAESAGGNTDLLQEVAATGDVPKLVELLEKYPIHSVKSTACRMVDSGKFDKFFEFLEHYVQERKYEHITDCFNFKPLLRALQDDELFQKYKSLAIKCLEEGCTTIPLISLFLICVKLPKRLPEAEALAQQYSTHFKTTSMEKLCHEAKSGGRDINFFRNFISSDILRTEFSDQYHVVFNRLIETYCSKKQYDQAVQYVEKAVSLSIGNLIDKDILRVLNKALKDAGQTFPHPELLSSD